MIVALPLDENKKDVCPSLGRCPFFMFRDSESGETKILENPAAEASGGAGLKSAQFIVDNDTEVLITVRCGENAAKVLKTAEIEIFKADGNDAENNITLYREEKLAPLTHFHAGFHGIQ